MVSQTTPSNDIGLSPMYHVELRAAHVINGAARPNGNRKHHAYYRAKTRSIMNSLSTCPHSGAFFCVQSESEAKLKSASGDMILQKSTNNVLHFGQVAPLRAAKPKPSTTETEQQYTCGIGAILCAGF